MSVARSILVVEDEEHIREMLKYTLSLAGFDVRATENIADAKLMLHQRIPDLLLLDWMLPGMSGIEYIRELKQDPNTRDIPVIILTAKAEEDHKIKGLDVGADDYITKPFSPRELVARIKSVLRRGPLATIDGVIQIVDLIINTNTHKVSILKHSSSHGLTAGSRRDENIHLSPTEYKLLHFLVTHKNRAYTREQLLNKLWGGEADIEDRAVDVQVRRLRKTLAFYGYDGMIETVRGVGYRFNEIFEVTK